MAKTQPKADGENTEKPVVIVEDSTVQLQEPPKPTKAETLVVNGHEMTFEDY
ncbi:hypothetical protein [Pseudoduganella lutea]|uniref:hypothetical protein n=1 Tax=Pseudoduganella lutea TaxID=321985 RepID=UPI0013EE71F7|nr:hypothetical protein [Pseudoduganella lutea]